MVSMVWSIIWSALTWVFKKLTTPLKDPFEEGERLGQLETGLAAAQEELSNVAKANTARDSISPDPDGLSAYADPNNRLGPNINKGS